MEREEYILGGGLIIDGDDSRVEVHIEEIRSQDRSGCGLNHNLIFVTGTAHLSILDIYPAEMLKLGKFLIETAKETMSKKP